MFAKTLIAAAFAAAVSSTAVQAADNITSIAVINVPLIMHEIPQAKASQEAMAKEFGPREQELRTLGQEGQKLAQDLQQGKLTGEKATEAQRHLAQLQSDYTLKGRALQEDMNKRGQEEQRHLATLVQQAVDAIAKERGLQLVIRETGVVYAVSALDISQDVIKRVAAQQNSTKK
ncbi:MAG: OmpH family outer membrane protein [Candidatus Anaerobiospirillum merdipullorum]|uniref:OmpH family outer membrane protein n=1 Tax=Candidatus Anaerobiospirillum merdipullorum TaxID=2838450 RepID=A0A9E2NS61_9GAMM|nr:OmpH family outer membrane protein [Candidatus Anaerobiospirillum merdipullorum]